MEEAAVIASNHAFSPYHSDGELIAEKIRVRIPKEVAFVLLETSAVRNAIGELWKLDGCACSVDSEFCYHSTIRELTAALTVSNL